MSHRHALFAFFALWPVVATAQDRCTAQGQAEQDRIIREFNGQLPPKGNRDAEQAWSRKLHDALAAAARRAEDCARASRPPLTPAAAATQEACLVASNRAADELQKKYAGRTLSMPEQTARRAEEQRLIDERMACARRTGRP